HATGCGWSSVDPADGRLGLDPSCPKALDPQQRTVPSWSRAQACALPLATVTYGRAPPSAVCASAAPGAARSAAATATCWSARRPGLHERFIDVTIIG